MPQKIRMWEVTEQNSLAELLASEISSEKWLEDWLENDISMLAPNLLVIGRQVRTAFGGEIDLLCLDNRGDTVIVELKKGRSPREVTAQVLDYASWVKDLSPDDVRQIASRHSKIGASLEDAFAEKFDEPWTGNLNENHRSLVVAESMDESTERIVRYLSDMHVPINIATVQHFTDQSGKGLLAQVYLVEPEMAEAKAKLPSKSRVSRSVSEIEAVAEANGLGVLFTRIREGASEFFDGVWASQTSNNNCVRYQLKLEGRGHRTVLYVYADADKWGANKDERGLPFEVQATWLSSYLDTSVEAMMEWFPSNTWDCDASNWPGSSREERINAKGLGGYFFSTEQIDKFLSRLADSFRDNSSKSA